MENRLKKSFGGLLNQVNQAIAGLELYAEPLGLRLVDATVMGADLTQFQAGETEVIQSKAELITRRAAYHAIEAEVRIYVFAGRDILKPYFGQRYSRLWDETGFVHSLKVPREAEKLAVLLLSFGAYFTAHPSHGNPLLNVTAARAQSLYDDLASARGAVNQQITMWKLAIAARDETNDRLRHHLRALLKELSLRLDPLDERWISFGFNKPGQQQTPLAPENVVVTVISPTIVRVEWDDIPNAKSFRIWKRVVGVDAEPVLAGKTFGPYFTMEELPTGVTIEVTITAMNSAGESRASKVLVVGIGGTNNSEPKLE